MARLPRLTVADLPYHITQRGNRRQPVFFTKADRHVYLALLQEQTRHYGVEVWAYCLMTNHIHLIVVPRREGTLSLAIAETHRRYTRHINFREGWRGYLWQGRFGSVALDESHLVAAVRYVERNPVTAGLVSDAAAYPWSSARAHVTGTPDAVLTPQFLTEQIRDWAAFLAEDTDDALGTTLSHHATVGRPLGSAAFLNRLEEQVGYSLQPRRPGRPKRLALAIEK